MPAKASGEVKTRIVRNTQKNGDIYVLERQTVYDPIKKQNKVLSTKLLTLNSIETRQPVAFTKQPGNLPDVITIENALKQLATREYRRCAA